MVGKLNQTIPKAHLQPIPAFDEPFSRIIIDCVGPLPKTKSGHEYLLTILCVSASFPEASLLGILKQRILLRLFFIFVGLPKCSVGSRLKFHVWNFQQVMYEFGISQYKSSLTILKVKEPLKDLI